MRKQYQKVVSTAVLTAGLLVATRSLAGSLDPTNAPGPTMHSLEDIYQEQMWLRARLTNGSCSFTTTNYVTPTLLPRTGQTNSFFAGDDGTYQEGIAWPNPRFSIGVANDSNCVTDHTTGLVWLRNPDVSPKNWTNAINYCEELNGDNGRDGYSDWRLPNYKELLSLIDARYVNPALPSTTGESHWVDNDPFIGIRSEAYWSSTTFAGYMDNARFVNVGSGIVNDDSKLAEHYAWPVRGHTTVYSGGSSRVHTNRNESTYGVNVPLRSIVTGQLSFSPVVPGSVMISATGSLGGYAVTFAVTDDGAGNLSGPSFNVPGSDPVTVSGKIIYSTGSWYLSMNGSVSYAGSMDFSTTYQSETGDSGGSLIGHTNRCESTAGVHVQLQSIVTGQLSFTPVVPGSVIISATGSLGGYTMGFAVSDDGAGNLSGPSFNVPGSYPVTVSGKIIYGTGSWYLNLGGGMSYAGSMDFSTTYQSEPGG